MKRCGSLCWTAQEEKCACICAGAYHGKNSEARRLAVKTLFGFLPKTLQQVRYVEAKIRGRLSEAPQQGRLGA